MKVSGFTFVRNAIRYDYPVVEAIQSILPLCDEVVVAVGNSEDETLALIQSIPSDKVRIIETVWDDSLIGGEVLARETEKAYRALDPDSDWAFYIQGDEVLHERYHEHIREAMEKWKDSPEVEGLVLKYLHFYGSYKYVADTRSWYRREVRIIRIKPEIFSYKDAQGFRIRPKRKIRAKLLDAYMYHYGYVRNPKVMQERKRISQKIFLGKDDYKDVPTLMADEFDYSHIDSLNVFEESHPKVLKERQKRMSWDFVFDTSKNKLSFKDKFLMSIERATGWRIGEYKNYRII